MGFFRRQLDSYREADYFFRFACRVLRLPAEGSAHVDPAGDDVDRAGAGIGARRARRMVDSGSRFGTVTSTGELQWTEPVHATTRNGLAVTVSFGLGLRGGQVLICGGHVTADDFRAMERDGLIEPHHYRVDGMPALPKIDRDRFIG